MKLPEITVQPEPDRPSAPWRVNVPAAVAVDGRRFRRWFVSESAARRFAAEQERAARNHTDRVFALTESMKEEAARCFALVSPYGRSLMDAVNESVARWQQESASVDLPTLRAAVVASKRQDRRGRQHLTSLNRCLQRFEEAFPGRMVSTILASEIDKWLRGLEVGPISRDSYRVLLSVAFGHALDQQWTTTNPVRQVKKAGGAPPEAVIFPPERIAAVLAAADARIVPWLALGAFAGLRPDEARRVPWSNIGPAGIVLTADITKTRQRRVVPYLPAVAAWLEPHRPADPGAARGVGAPLSTHRRLLRKAAKVAGMPAWPKDGLRKSWISYRYTLLQNENQVASEAGNSPGIVHKYYRALTDAPTAERWFSLRPNGCKLSDDYCGGCASPAEPALPAVGVRSSAGLDPDAGNFGTD